MEFDSQSSSELEVEPIVGKPELDIDSSERSWVGGLLRFGFDNEQGFVVVVLVAPRFAEFVGAVVPVLAGERSEQVVEFVE